MRRAPLVLTPQHFGSLVFDHATSRYLPFDHEATALLRQLATTPLSRLELAGDELEAVGRFVDAFEPLGLFTPDGRFAGAVRDVTPPADHLLGPLVVHLEVMGACNLSCAHCFAAPLPRHHEPLTLPELERLFDELAALGTYRLGLTGGEPLLRDDLLDIIDAASTRGLHCALTTNGLLLDERWARELGRRELLWLNVSLDGATAATNDAVRGSGTFARVLERLPLLARHCRFTLAFTVMRHNAHEVEAFAQLAQEVGAHAVVFRPLYPAGAARTSPGRMPDFEQYTAALAKVTGSADVLDVDVGAVSATLGCAAAHTIASVSVRGDVSPCSFLGAGQEVANVRNRPFAELWHEGPGFVAMRAMSKVRHPGRFSGGCRARALAANGDVDASDPWQEAFERSSVAAPPSLTRWVRHER